MRETDRKNYHIGKLYWKGSKKQEQYINIVSFTSKIDNKVYDLIERVLFHNRFKSWFIND